MAVLSQECNQFTPISLNHFSNNNKNIVILPSGEADKSLQASFIDSVRVLVQNKMPNSIIVFDTCCTRNLLCGKDVFIFGSLNGNKFIKENKSTLLNTLESDIRISILDSNKTFSISFAKNNIYDTKRALFVFTGSSIGDISLKYFANDTIQYAIIQNQTLVKFGKYKSYRNSLEIKENETKCTNSYSIINDSTFKFKKNHTENKIISFNNLFDKKNHLITSISDSIKNKKMIFIGENHDYLYNKTLFIDIFSAINKTDYFSTIILEYPYSYTPFLNYFINIEDSIQSKIFFKNSLADFIITDGDYMLIESFRNWNNTNKTKKISIICSDLEFKSDILLNKILIPIVNLNYGVGCLEGLDIGMNEYFLSKLDSIFKRKDFKIKGEYSDILNINILQDLSKSLMQTFYSYIIMYNDTYDNYMNFRVKAIIDNIVRNTNFQNKVIFYGGSYHTETKNLDNKNTEGYFFSNIFEPSKNSTFSIQMICVGFDGKESFTNINLDAAMKVSFPYYKKVKNISECNLIKQNDKLTIFNDFTVIPSLLLSKSLEKDSNKSFSIIKKVNWYKAYNQTNNRDDILSVDFYYNSFKNHNSIIIVPFSPIISPINN